MQAARGFCVVMNLRTLFEYRSGRVIAVFRVVLALVFFGSVLIEPVTGTADLRLGEMLLGAYLLLGMVLIVLAWRSWWYDQRLATAMLVVDVIVFLTAVYLTESSDADFTSPFLALFALIVLSATLRWDWRAAARAGVIVTVLFVAVGFAMTAAHFPLDFFRFGRRAFYMAALLLVLVWFGIQRREPHVPMLDIPADDPSGPSDPIGTRDFANTADRSLWRALEFAMNVIGAQRGMLAWSDADEPWIELRSIDPDGRTAERVGPEALVDWEAASREVRLFNLVHGRKLVRTDDGAMRAIALVSPVFLGTVGGITEGLSLPFHSVSGEGLLVLGGISGLGPDYITLGQGLAREIGRAVDRQTVARFERDALVARTRSAIARDLHDSVAQSLAGACFRLEALRQSIHQTQADDFTLAESQIVSVRDALRREQGHVRSLIESLRAPAQPPQCRDLHADLAATLADAATHWGIVADFVSTGPADVPGWLSHEIQQLVREAVANAARHGRATCVRVELTAPAATAPVPTGLAGTAGLADRIKLAISDDGRGFDAAAQASRPWSISERVATLDGDLTVDSGTTGSRLAISLPTGPLPARSPQVGPPSGASA